MCRQFMAYRNTAINTFIFQRGNANAPHRIILYTTLLVRKLPDV